MPRERPRATVDRFLEQGRLVTARRLPRSKRIARAQLRVDTLWEELLIPQRDRDAFNAHFRADEARLAEQIELLLRHRRATVDVLQAVQRRERARVDLLGCYEALARQALAAELDDAMTDGDPKPSGGGISSEPGPERARQLAEAAEAAVERASQRRQALDEVVVRLGGDGWTHHARATLERLVRCSCFVLEAVERWRCTMWRPRGFLWRRTNYLMGMATDCAFLTTDTGARLQLVLRVQPAQLLPLLPQSRTKARGKPGGFLDSARDRERFREAATMLLAEPECAKQLARERRTLLRTGQFLPVLRWTLSPEPQQPRSPPPLSSPERWAHVPDALKHAATEHVRSSLAGASALRALRTAHEFDSEDSDIDPAAEDPEAVERDRAEGALALRRRVASRRNFEAARRAERELERSPSPSAGGGRRTLVHRRLDHARAADALLQSQDQQQAAMPDHRRLSLERRDAVAAAARTRALQRRVRKAAGARAFLSSHLEGRDMRAMRTAEHELQLGVNALAELRLLRGGALRAFREAQRGGDARETEVQAARLVQLWWQFVDARSEAAAAEATAVELRRVIAARVVQRAWRGSRRRTRRASVFTRAAVAADADVLAQDPGELAAAAAAVRLQRELAAARAIVCTARSFLARRQRAAAAIARQARRRAAARRVAEVRRLRREAAASVVQAHWRGHRARSRVDELRTARAEALQRAAALLLGAAARRWARRRRRRERRARQVYVAAARVLQCWWRRLRLAARVAALEGDRERLEEENAAIVLQRGVREWQGWRRSLGRGERPRRKPKDWFRAFDESMQDSSMKAVVGTLWRVARGGDFMTPLEARQKRWRERGGSDADGAADAVQSGARLWLARRNAAAARVTRAVWRRRLQLALRRGDEEAVVVLVLRHGWPDVWPLQMARRAAIRRLAATTVQSWRRGELGRRRAAPLRAARQAAAQDIARVWRGSRGRAVAAVHRRARAEQRAAAVALQCAFRVSRAVRAARAARAERARRMLAATLCQAAARRWAAGKMLTRMRAQRELQRRATAVVSAWWRRRLLARQCDYALWAWQAWHELCAARALAIQCAWRCARARRWLARLRAAEEALRVARRNAAARRIQGVVQTRQARRRFLVGRRGVLALQARVRGVRGRAYAKHIADNVKRLQVMFRAMAARRRFDQLRAAIPRPMRVVVTAAGSLSTFKRLFATVEALDGRSGDVLMTAAAVELARAAADDGVMTAEVLLPGVDGLCTLRVRVDSKAGALRRRHLVGYAQLSLKAKPLLWKKGGGALLPLAPEMPVPPSDEVELPLEHDHLGSPLARAATRRFTDRALLRSEMEGPCVDLSVRSFRVPDMCGYVKRRVHGARAHWEQQWCALAGSALQFYKEYGETKVRHAFRLDHSTSVEVIGTQHVIHVQSNKESLHIHVADAADRKEWVYAIARVVR